jgi:hypothetical protein
VNGVAWSTDGRLATASTDNATRVWDVQAGKSALLLVGGAGGRWLGCQEDSGTCLRFDDGALVRKLERQLDTAEVFAAVVHPLPPPSSPPEFRVVDMDEISVADGVQRRISVKVRNAGGNAFGVRLLLKPAGDGPAPIVAVANDAVPKIAAGEVAELRLTVVGVAPPLNPAPMTAVFSLEVEHGARDRRQLRDVNAELLAPALGLAGARLQRRSSGSRLHVRIVNRGTLPAIGLTAHLDKLDSGRSAAVPVMRMAPAGAAEEVVFDVSERQASSISEAGRVTLSVATDFAQPDLGDLYPFLTWNTAVPAAVTDVRMGMTAYAAAELSLATGVAHPHLAAPRIFHTWTVSAPVVVIDGRTGMMVYGLAGLVAVLLTAAFFVVVVFSNPLLRQVSATPDGILSTRIDDLPRAKRLLQFALRLQAILAGANVAPDRLDTAIRFARSAAAEARAEVLKERLELEFQDPLQTTDKGTAFVRALTSRDLPLNLPRIRLVFPPAGMDAEDVMADVRRLRSGYDRMTVIAPADRQQDIALRAITAERTESAAVLSGTDLTGILLSAQPQKVFARALSEQVPPARLSVYQRAGGVDRAEAFFGRENEIAAVLNRDPANYFLVGGRKIGKSSLLKALTRHIRGRREFDCAYIVLADADLRWPLVNELKLSRNATLDDAYAHLSRPDSRLRYVFIDEADRFIAQEARTGYQNLAVCRRLSEEGRVHFIFTGYWELYRTMVFEYNSPLTNFGGQIRLGTLDEAACRRLATDPMDALNLRYESPELVTAIYRATAGRANLMVVACDEIIKMLDREERVISVAAVGKVLRGIELRSQLDGWDSFGYDNDGTDEDAMRARRLDRIIVYSTVTSDTGTFMFTEVQRCVADAGLDYTADEIRKSLARLTLAVIVHSDDGINYRYCIPIFVEYLNELDLNQARSDAIAEAARAGRRRAGTPP